MSRKLVIAVTVAAAALLSACGGGGGGGGDGPAPPAGATFNLDAAFANTLAQGINFPDLRANWNGLSFQLSIASTPTSDGVFLSQSYHRAIQTLRVTVNGEAAPPVTSTLYFTLSPVTLVGGLDDEGITIFTPQGSLPTAARVGESGPYTRGDTYVSESNRTLLGQTLVGWTLEPGTAAMAWACLLYSGMDSVPFEKDCYLIDTAGAIFGAKATMNFPDGTTLTFE